MWLRYTGGRTNLETIRTIGRIDPKTRKVVSRNSGDSRRSRSTVVLPIPTTTGRRCGPCHSPGNWSHEAPSQNREHETSDEPPHIIRDASTSRAYVTNELLLPACLIKTTLSVFTTRTLRHYDRPACLISSYRRSRLVDRSSILSCAPHAVCFVFFYLLASRQAQLRDEFQGRFSTLAVCPSRGHT